MNKKVWIKKHEYVYYFDILFRVLLIDHRFKRSYNLFVKRITSFIQSNTFERNVVLSPTKSMKVKFTNRRFIYEYLKDCYTIVLNYHSTGQYIPKSKVSLNSTGLPNIIPRSLRNNISDRRVFILVCTSLAIFRVISYFPDVDLSTITGPFTGLTRTFEHNVIAKSLMHLKNISLDKYSFPRLSRMRMSSLSFESAGPNSSYANSGIVLDALSLIKYPSALYHLLRLYLKFKGYRYIICLCAIILIGFIPYSISLLFDWNLVHLNRLSIVRNVTGKSRVIGITNYWFQLGLYPLHEEIFRFLGSLPTDGTFDQTRPIFSDHLKKCNELHSLDLSAATDRLPIDLQEQIISILFRDSSLGNIWRSLLTQPFFYEGSLIRYSVGQPMGAYSSWAMLALTHHVIVQACSPTPTLNYAVLGDDVGIDGELSNSYINLMTSLGVKISLPKSIISSNFIEFAKRFIDIKENNDFTTLGPGLILASIRNRFLIPLLISESFKRKLINIPESVNILKSFKLDFNFGLFALFGINGLILKDHKAHSNEGVLWLKDIYNSGVPLTALQYSLYNALVSTLMKKHQSAVQKATSSLYMYWWHIITSLYHLKKAHLLVLFTLPSQLFVPAWYRLYLNLWYTISLPKPALPSGGGWDQIESLATEIGDLAINDLANLSNQDIKQVLYSYRNFEKEFSSTLKDLIMFESPEGHSDFY